MSNQPADLVETMAVVARLLHRENGMQAIWSAITRLAAERLDGVEHAGITVVTRGRSSTPAATDDLPLQVDMLQYRLHEGPCLDAITEQQSFRTGDLSQETERWPKFGPRVAAEYGVYSMVSYRLFVQDETFGALNFYSRSRDAFDDALTWAGTAFAVHASLALAYARKDEHMHHLQRALDSNRVIGAAMGVLMAQRRLTEQQAFDVLRQFSQDTQRKLRDVADDVVQTGTTSDVPPRPARSR